MGLDVLVILIFMSRPYFLLILISLKMKFGNALRLDPGEHDVLEPCFTMVVRVLIILSVNGWGLLEAEPPT